MLFSSAILTVTTVIGLASASPTAPIVQERGLLNAYFTKPGFDGRVLHPKLKYNECFNFPPDFDRQVASLEVKNSGCYFYNVKDCDESARGPLVKKLYPPGEYASLKTYVGQGYEGVFRSVRCL